MAGEYPAFPMLESTKLTTHLDGLRFMVVRLTIILSVVFIRDYSN